METRDSFAVKINNLFKDYEGKNIFYNFNMKFEKNKITIIIGPSGCGKTTLLNIIAGIDREYKGEVQVNRERIAYVFQEDRLLPNLTAIENIAFVLKSGMKRTEATNIADKYLHMVELGEFKNNFPEELSGGMKRRISLGRAAAYEGSLVLMDEPFKGLDILMKTRIMEKLLKLHVKRKDTIIMVTHDKEEAEKMGDIIYSLN